MVGIIFCIVIALALVFVVYSNIRNDYVFAYSIDLTDRCYSICKRYLDSIDKNLPDEEVEKLLVVSHQNDEMWNSIEASAKYDKLLWSFKPLKDKYWLTEEQLKWLEQYKEG